MGPLTEATLKVECEKRKNKGRRTQTNNNDSLEKDGGTKNISMYKDLWSGIQGLVSAY